MKNQTKSRKPKSPGQGLVEFALALPILLLLVLGLIEFARIFSAWMIVENSARTAARYAVTGQFNTTYCEELFGSFADPKAKVCDLTVAPSTNPDEMGKPLWGINPSKTPKDLCDMLWPGGYNSQPAACRPKDTGDPSAYSLACSGNNRAFPLESHLSSLQRLGKRLPSTPDLHAPSWICLYGRQTCMITSQYGKDRIPSY